MKTVVYLDRLGQCLWVNLTSSLRVGFQFDLQCRLLGYNSSPSGIRSVATDNQFHLAHHSMHFTKIFIEIDCRSFQGQYKGKSNLNYQS